METQLSTTYSEELFPVPVMTCFRLSFQETIPYYITPLDFDLKLTADISVVGQPETIFLTDEEILGIEKKIFERRKKDLLSDFEGKYVAFANGNVLDSDEDMSELSKRVYEKYGYQNTIYMPQVLRDEKKHRIVTPKFRSKKN